MSEKRGKNPSQRMHAPGGDVFDVGAVGRNPITGRTGAMVMRTVSLFLTSGRKVSLNNSRQRQQSGASGQNSPGSRGRRRRRMPDNSNMKTSAYHAKIVDTLKKKTRFTRVELEALCKIYRRLTTNPSPRAGSTLDGKSGAQSNQTVEVITRFFGI